MDWFAAVKQRHPAFFHGARVLEIGSLNINGTVRELFEGGEYVGLDLAEGPGVDVVCVAGACDAPAFDVVCSSSCFEHDLLLPMTLTNAVRLLRPGGLMVWTCATASNEHGTRRCGSADSPFTTQIPAWRDFYHNVTEEDVRSILDLDALFSDYTIETYSIDLRFRGLKRD